MDGGPATRTTDFFLDDAEDDDEEEEDDDEEENEGADTVAPPVDMNLGHLKTEVHQQAGPSKPHGHEQPLAHTV